MNAAVCSLNRNDPLPRSRFFFQVPTSTIQPIDETHTRRLVEDAADMGSAAPDEKSPRLSKEFIMNKFLASALIAAAGFAAAPSFAGQYLGGEVGYFANDAQVTSPLTRAQVQAEATRAVQQGLMIGGRVLADRPTVAAVANTSDVTRAQVRAETVYAVQHGLRIGGEV